MDIIKSSQGIITLTDFDIKAIGFLVKLDCQQTIRFYKDEQLLQIIIIQGRSVDTKSQYVIKYSDTFNVQKMKQINKSYKPRFKNAVLPFPRLIGVISEIDYDDVEIDYNQKEFTLYKPIIEYACSGKINPDLYTDKLILFSHNMREKYYELDFKWISNKPNSVFYYYDNNSILIFNTDGFSLLDDSKHDFTSIFDFL